MKICKVAAAPKSPLIRNEIVEREEVHWNTKESARDSSRPSRSKFEAGDFGENVYPDRRYPNLINHLLLSEGLGIDSVML